MSAVSAANLATTLPSAPTAIEPSASHVEPKLARPGIAADELADLVRSFTEVTERLQTTHTALQSQVGQLQAELAEANEQLQRSRELAALGEMAAGIAHEIRNPLGAIKGAAELIAPGRDGRLPADEDVVEFSQIILEETRRLGRVVSQFLDYARPLRGDYQPIDINDVVRRTEALLRPLAEELKNDSPAGFVPPEIVVQLTDDLPKTRGDAEQLRQVFLNLGLNALQAMAESSKAARSANPELEAPRGRLSITTGLRHGGRLGGPTQHIEVRFSDTGPGLDPAAQKNLFIPFFTTKERGTGLGLAISQRIVENHDGFIEVRTRTTAAGAAGAMASATSSSSAHVALPLGSIAPMIGSSTTGSTAVASSGTTFLVVLPVTAE